MNKTTTTLAAALTGAALLLPGTANATPQVPDIIDGPATATGIIEPPLVPNHHFVLRDGDVVESCEFGKQRRTVLDTYVRTNPPSPEYAHFEVPLAPDAPYAPPSAALDCSGVEFAGIGADAETLYDRWISGKREVAKKAATIAKVRHKLTLRERTIRAKTRTIKKLRARIGRINQRPPVPAVAAVLSPCEYEDSRNCLWLASEIGNGVGRSFIDLGGKTYFFEPSDR